VRFDVDCVPGELAGHPEEVLQALIELAVQDGADPQEWLEKAMKAAGATTADVHVPEEPAYQVVVDARDELQQVYRRIRLPMLQAIKAVLEQAAREADLDHLREAVRQGE
jgi:hypothetical protein